MRQGFSKKSLCNRWKPILCLAGILAFSSGCSISTSPSTDLKTTATTTLIATITPTAGTVQGVCRASDFPPPIKQRPAIPTGGDPGPFYGAPISDFPFPPDTYYYDLGPAAGTHFWKVCSSGDPTSILAFMRQSIAASSWQLLPSSDPSTLKAQKPVSSATPGAAASAYCYTLQVMVGSFPEYPGEWSFATFSPAEHCV